MQTPKIWTKLLKNEFCKILHGSTLIIAIYISKTLLCIIALDHRFKSDNRGSDNLIYQLATLQGSNSAINSMILMGQYRKYNEINTCMHIGSSWYWNQTREIFRNMVTCNIFVLCLVCVCLCVCIDIWIYYINVWYWQRQSFRDGKLKSVHYLCLIKWIRLVNWLFIDLVI